MTNDLIAFIRDLYGDSAGIQLHEPIFQGNESNYVLDAIDSTFVSSVGKYVEDFESIAEQYSGSQKCVAVVNGTAALTTALHLCGVTNNHVVLTPSLNFIDACNAITSLGAEPAFIDSDLSNLGLCPIALKIFLEEKCIFSREKGCLLKSNGANVSAMIVLHTFGHPAAMTELSKLASEWRIDLIEDAAESLGSFYGDQHTGTIGRFGIWSFNGNKIITTGGGGMILSKDLKDGLRAKHITTTAKVKHKFEFIHDEPGFNYRMPNLNAALGVAQFEKLSLFLQQKRKIAAAYEAFFAETDLTFVKEPSYGRSNYWLNTILAPDRKARDEIIEKTNAAKVSTRPLWRLMHKLPMFDGALKGDLTNSEWLEDRIISLPSSAREIG